MNKVNFDIDIDCRNRDEILKYIDHSPASMKKDDELIKHNTGVYVQYIPTDPLNGFASYDYKEAEELGYLKLDFLNVSVYDFVRDEDHLTRLMDKEPNWNKLLVSSFCEKLIHIGSYYDIVSKMKPSNVTEMAMMLAIIRPGKKHLIGKSWDHIAKTVWDKTDDDYSFKRSHSISYSTLVCVHMNILEEQGY